MLVLGIDPGAVRTGLAWIRETKGMAARASFRIECRERYPFRYPELERALLARFRELPEDPCAVAIEEPDLEVWKDSDPRAVFHLHGAYAVAVAAVCRIFRRSILHHLRPGSWKGAMPKEETARTLRVKYGWPDAPTSDESDALGLADFAFEVAKRTAPPARAHDWTPPPPAQEDELGRAKCIHCGDLFRPHGRVVLVGPDGRGKVGSLPYCKPCGPVHGPLTTEREAWLGRFERILRAAGRIP